jgi:predicted nucleic acid-binding Zn ribbon protein
MSGRRRPKPAGDAIRALTERLAPASTLGDVQRVWDGVVGDGLAAVASPTAEAGGTLTVTCASAVWAQELDLMSADLVGRLNEALGAQRLSGMRCQSVPAKSWSRSRA